MGAQKEELVLHVRPFFFSIFFLFAASGQMSPCTVSDLCGLNLSYMEARKMPPAARMPLVLVQMWKDTFQSCCWVQLMWDGRLW